MNSETQRYKCLLEQRPVKVEGCYLLHFDSPLSHARHYIGWSWNIDQRVEHHAMHPDRPHMLRELKKAGISFTLVRIWPGYTRDQERLLKNRHEGPKFCPLCNSNLLQLPEFYYVQQALQFSDLQKEAQLVHV
jgi:hypothetical protein